MLTQAQRQGAVTTLTIAMWQPAVSIELSERAVLKPQETRENLIGFAPLVTMKHCPKRAFVRLAVHAYSAALVPANAEGGRGDHEAKVSRMVWRADGDCLLAVCRFEYWT